MADPLSIASGVAGLVSLGLTLCGGLHNYFSAVRDRHQEIETAAQSLDLLQSNIFIIQSSTLRLGHRHALSANGVNQGLANCESQLITLQQMMLDLTRDEGLSDMKGKLRKQMTIARYPFDQKRLVQLQDQLFKANTALSTFVQNFNLDINIGISEDLQILKSYTNASDSITHSMLGAIARRLDIIGSAVERTEIEMATMSRHARGNCLTTTSRVSDILVGPRYLRGSQKEETVMKTLNDPECTCSHPTTSSIQRQSSYVDRSCGGFVISKQEHKRQRHHLGCKLFNQSLQTLKITLTYLGCRYWFSRSLALSLTRYYPAGAYSLSFEIQPCNIVESSPAFEALHDLEEKYFRHMKTVRTHQVSHSHLRDYEYATGQYHGFDLREETLALIKKLRTIYSSGAASPFDVDHNGNNIAHICMDYCREQLVSLPYIWGLSFREAFKSISSLLSYMFDTGVPITASNFHQRTILDSFCESYYVTELPLLYKFIARLDTALCVEDIAHGETEYPKGMSKFESLQVWGDHPDIAEAFGFNDIFRAVMQRDRQKIEAITMSGQIPPGILETDMYGRNILQACISWPEGLRLLLQQSQFVSLLLYNESTILSPLQLAVKLSGRICTQAVEWVLCQNCHCTAAVKILLEADCCLPGNLMLPRCLEQCSLRCRKLLFKHLEDRRRRLRDLSLALLPSKVIDWYGVTIDYLPDATACSLWEELKSYSGESTREEFGISQGLKPFCSNHYCGGFFENPLSRQIFSLADEFGIKPTDEGGLQPLLARVPLLGSKATFPFSEFKMKMDYLDWLLRQDLKLEYVASGFQTSALHDLGARVGKLLFTLILFPDRNVVHNWSGNAISVMNKICNSGMQSNLPCPCVSGACNRPLASLMSGFAEIVRYGFGGNLAVIRSMRDLAARIEETIPNVDTSYLARCAVHTITIELLGIRHVGPCPTNNSRCRRESADESEWAELLDEDRLLLEKLDDLEEFEIEFQSRNESVADFLGGYYAQRILEVMKEMDGFPADDYRRQLHAAGVVLLE
ncbi:hypothetical protein QL093DRAFT_2593264, partial [Fusarium oxysporum]